MKIIIQKFGGSSLSSSQGKEEAISHIRTALDEGFSVCVVVSAMGRAGDPYATDTLIQWIEANGSSLEKREWDLLLHCGEIISATTLCSLLNNRKIKSTVLTGGQAGIVTDGVFGNAQIQKIDPQIIREQLTRNQVVIVTGFQGRTEEWEITTLGRGGSDTSATAIGAALQAQYVDIFTDVEGVMTADPRIVEDAQQLSQVTYVEIANMAHQGAKVIHPRAVEVAMQANVPIRVRSTFSKSEGTLVYGAMNMKADKLGVMPERLITGIAHIPDLTQVKVLALEGRYDVQLRVFKTMAEHGISVDFINVNPKGVVYTVKDEVAGQAAELLRTLGFEPILTPHCAKVSVVGAGMAGVPGVMAQISEALADEDIPILQSADSHTTIWLLVKNEDMASAVKALHRKFNLHKKDHGSVPENPSGK
jgi:aspartate kinase